VPRRMDTESLTWADGQPDPAKYEEVQRKSSEQMRTDLAEVRSVLGEAKYREFEEYQAMLGVRQEADRLRTTLAGAGVPLDDSLRKPLVKTLYEQQQKLMQQEQLKSVENYQRQRREALARVLTPQQIKVIEEQQEAELQLQRAQLRIMRAQQEAGLDATQDVGLIGYAEQAVSFAPESHH
jgi:hypothetical protein